MDNQVNFSGSIVVLGLGAIAQCLGQVLRQHVCCPAGNVVFLEIGDASPEQITKIREQGFQHHVVERITKSNFKTVLKPYLGDGDLLINLTCSVDSIAVMDFVHSEGMMYVDSSFEIWDEDQVENVEDMQHQTLYALHHRAREITSHWQEGSPTAISNHGANPGVVNHLAKAAIIELARELKIDFVEPQNSQEWASLCRSLDIKVIHISERDTQVSVSPKSKDEFRNTWSPMAFMDEASSPAEIGWGTHEKVIPERSFRHEYGPNNAVFFHKTGGEIFVRSWLPNGGQIHGFMMPHSECVTLSEYFSLYDNGELIYRPTVKFAYLPSPEAFVSIHEYMMNDEVPHKNSSIMNDDIQSGVDELGVLLLGHERKAFWYGSNLDITEARKIAPGNNATTVQVVGGVISAVIWCLNNPSRGYCETEDLPYKEILSVAEPYIAPVLQAFSDWQPSEGGAQSDTSNDVWQYTNFIVGR